MKILLVANYKPDRQRSMARYTGLLAEQLRKRGVAVEVIHPPPIATRIVSAESRFFRWLAYLDKFIFFPPMLWLRAGSADVVHICDHSNSFYLRWTGKSPALITAHDALAIRSALGHFPQNPTRSSGVKLQRWILGNLARAKAILCVSQKTKADFEALLPADVSLIVIPNPLSGEFHPSTPEEITAARAACGLQEQDEYLLHVGKNNWYKNRAGVLRIFAELKNLSRFRRMKLLLAGDRLPPALLETAQETGDVLECVAPTDAQLRALYSGALALLFPSLEEGFGWPILEAQGCGCPVITSDRPPMNEITGGAAILIDPENAEAAAATIAARIHQTNELRTGGLANVRSYSVEIAMDRYSKVYEETIKG
jgi:glycosyltransferase involved in cell wall biosynthesis